MNKLPISVCIISGAEAQRIGRLLASVAGWTSEIVVVLNEGVEDGTQDRRMGFHSGAKKWAFLIWRFTCFLFFPAQS